jgi:hypothetical protein
MEQMPKTGRYALRFSLRELLLLMLAAAAFIAWAALAYRSGRLKPTKFFTENETWETEVAAVLQELGEPSFSGAAGTTMHSEGTAANQRTFVFRIPLPEAKIDGFIGLFVKRVRSKLTAAGCKLAGGAAGSGANHVNVLGYHTNAVSGTIQVCVGEAGSDRVTVVLTMTEQQGSSTGFGLINQGN